MNASSLKYSKSEILLDTPVSYERQFIEILKSEFLLNKPVSYEPQLFLNFENNS